MPKRPTQTDVAELAGVSRATVSYVLSNRTSGRISITQETRERVLKAAQELGYEPSALARSLRSGLSHTIGLLIPDIHNPHYLDILSGVDKELTECGYYLCLVSANLDPERESRCLRSLFQQRLDGLILLPTFADLFADEVEALSKRSSPAVFISPVQGADWVLPDIPGGAELLLNHVLSLGHRRIGFINGVARRNMGRERLNVYRHKLAALGLPANGQLICHCGHTIQDGYAAAQELLTLSPPPTAIWTINDLLAVGALRAIRERGLRVPDDISLAGFDDIDLASQLYPPLTTVRLHGEEIGRRAAQVLFQRIQDPKCEPMQETIDTELVIRQSTAPVRTSMCA